MRGPEATGEVAILCVRWLLLLLPQAPKRRVEDFTGEAPAGEGERADPVERWGRKMEEFSSGQ